MARQRKEEGHEHLGTCLGHTDKAIRILYHAVAYLTKRVDALEKAVRKLKTQGVKIMETIASVRAEAQALKDAAAAREARDTAQDAVTTQNMQVLNDRITALEAQIATGGLPPEQQALLEDTVADLKAVHASLDAADPTPPVV